jgi:hypothetical protein
MDLAVSSPIVTLENMLNSIAIKHHAAEVARGAPPEP